MVGSRSKLTELILSGLLEVGSEQTWYHQCPVLATWEEEFIQSQPQNDIQLGSLSEYIEGQTSQHLLSWLSCQLSTSSPTIIVYTSVRVLRSTCCGNVFTAWHLVIVMWH